MGKIKNYIKTYDNIQNITTGQGDDYTTGCLLDYNYLIKHYKMKTIGLRKPEAFDDDPKAMQQSNVTGNLSGTINRAMFFIIEEAKEIIFDLSQGTVKVL